MHRIILIIILVFCSSSSWSSKFSLDKFNIEINSNFLGEEIVLFGQKDEGRDLIIIFEGTEKQGKLFTKNKRGLLWINEKQELDKIPRIGSTKSIKNDKNEEDIKEENIESAVNDNLSKTEMQKLVDEFNSYISEKEKLVD